MTNQKDKKVVDLLKSKQKSDLSLDVRGSVYFNLADIELTEPKKGNNEQNRE